MALPLIETLELRSASVQNQAPRTREMDLPSNRGQPLARRLAPALCCLLALASCSGGPPSTSAPVSEDSHDKNTIRQITIRTPTGWLLAIESDGAGNVGYGSSAHDFARFPNGTFDFGAVRDSLLRESVRAGSIRTGFAVAFARAGEISTTARYVSDGAMMRALFDKAVASADKTGTRVDELYATYPPLPDAPAPAAR